MDVLGRLGRRPGSALRLALLLALAAPLACGGPSIGDGTIRCGANSVCPPGFGCAADGLCYRAPAGPDAAPAVCGNGTLEVGETCDPPATCPVECADGNPCTVDSLVGSVAACTAACRRTFVEACGPADGCCPTSCSASADADCSSSCGNETLEAGETCDPPHTCLGLCDDGDACTSEAFTGSPENCNVVCVPEPILECISGDGCCAGPCPVGVVDDDCGAVACATAICGVCDGCCPANCTRDEDCERCEVPGSCGDGCCACTEAKDTCAADCARSPVCGDGLCELGECGGVGDPAVCVNDCPWC